MSELRTKKQTDPPPEPDGKTARWGRGVQIVPALFCILLLVVSPVTAADAGLYEDTGTGGDLHHQSAPNASVQDQAEETLMHHQDTRDQQIIHYVEENKSADHGEGVRQVRASVLRQIADLEDRGYDVTDLRSALESGDEEQIKNALSNISACTAGT